MRKKSEGGVERKPSRAVCSAFFPSCSHPCPVLAAHACPHVGSCFPTSLLSCHAALPGLSVDSQLIFPENTHRLSCWLTVFFLLLLFPAYTFHSKGHGETQSKSKHNFLVPCRSSGLMKHLSSFLALTFTTSSVLVIFPWLLQNTTAKARHLRGSLFGDLELQGYDCHGRRMTASRQA